VGPDSRRILTAAILSVAILLGWQLLFPQQPKPPPASPRPPVAAPAPAAPPGTAGPAAAPAAPPAPAAEPGPAAPEELVMLETADFRATFTSRGGALKSYLLKSPKYLREVSGRTEPVDLVSADPRGPSPFAVAASPELGGAARPEEDPSARASMRVLARDGRSVTFEGSAGSSRIVKTFALGDRPFELSLRLQIAGDRVGSVQLLSTGYLAPDAPKQGFFSGGAFHDFVRPICRAGDKTERFTSDKAEEKLAGNVAWAGLEQFYFVQVLLPEKPSGECTFLRGPAAGALATALRLPVDRTLDARFTLIIGPKQLDLLKRHGRSLDEAIDYGPITRYFAFFAQILMKLMRWFEGFVANWGLAIILLTVTVKLVLLPLTLKSMQSMNEMRKLQPEIEKLRERFKDDKEQLNLAVMKMYQEHKVNPLGGCLPLLLQMPVFFALWAALQNSVELYREPFLWIRDLSLHDPIYVLPLVMGGSMFLMQKLSPQPADSTQAKMLLYFMPIFFTFIMFQLPAGLALYSVVNNLLSIGQQQILMRRMGPPQAAAAGRGT
jgi:YidC/Oxa1 family membrane protein insertase